MNLPNKLTIFRLILVPIMVAIPFLNIQSKFLGIPLAYWIMNLIFGVASYTDHLDGKIARKNNLVTTFGKFADPLADKILVLAAMLILVEDGNLPAWIPIIVLFREFVVSGYRLVAVEKGGEVIAASFWGKLKTVTQMIAIILVFIDKFNYFDFLIANTNKAQAMASSIQIYMTTPELIFNCVTSILMLVSVGAIFATVFRKQ